MDGIHDLGGMHGFGPIEIDLHEPRFHAEWEGRVVGIMGQLLGRGVFNIDAFRFGIESMAPAHYLMASYFERWRTSLERNLAAAGVLSPGELAALGWSSDSMPPRAVAVRTSGSVGGGNPFGVAREIADPPLYRVDQPVRARNLHPEGHTRLPRYVRGKLGHVDRLRGGFVFPDSNAHGKGENPQHLYSVRFDASELWGEAAEPDASVSIDLFESYLEAAGEVEA